YEYSKYDGYLIVATEANTTISRGGTVVATLTKPGDVYYYYGNNSLDLTGTYITASKPVAYFVSNSGSQVPAESGAVEILYQQMMPENTWGTKFLVPSSVREKDIVRVIASIDNTEISYNGGKFRKGGTSIGTNKVRLAKGAYLELEIGRDENGIFISSGGKPVAVCSYLVGSGYASDEPTGGGNFNGDPAMAWIPPVEQFIPDVVISPFKLENGPNHYALIVVPAGSESKTIAKEGTSTTVPLTGSWKTNSGYSYYSLDLSSDIDGVYSIANSDGLMVLVYGYGSSESYYYLAGSAARDLNPHFTVNEEHYQDMYGSVYCDDGFNFEAFITSRQEGSTAGSYAPGSLKWYIKKDNGSFVEETAARDVMSWSKTLTPGLYQVRMEVIDAANELDVCLTQFTVNEITTPTLEGNLSPCIGDQITYTTQSGMTNYYWTVTGTANTDYVITEGGTSTSNTISILWLRATPQTIGVSFLNSSDCEGGPTTITVSPKSYMTATLSGNQTPCTYEDIVYTTQSDKSNYQWSISGTAGTDYVITNGGTSSSSTITIQWLVTTTQTVSVNYSDANYCVNASTPLSVTPEDCCPPITVWLGVNSNWDDIQNWYPAVIPQSCTDVYIPGNVSVFPSLESTGSNTCDNIYFLPNAQLGQPQYLNYNSAHVQLDYGAGSLNSRPSITSNYQFVLLGKDRITSEFQTQFGVGKSGLTLERERWNMLSAPLKSIWPGDYAFGGFPISFIRKFDPDKQPNDASTFIKGRWSNYSNETTYEFTAGEGFCHFLYGMENDIYSLDSGNLWEEVAATDPKVVATQPVSVSGNPFGLAKSNGIIQLPYYNDSYLSDAHRNHEYNEEDETSTFHFFLQSPKSSADFMQFTGNKESKKRENANRFIAENEDGSSMDVVYNRGKITDPQESEFVLLGNPYMSTLDFEMFFQANADLIKDNFQIYDGDIYHVSNHGDNIAPMQSFLVELREGYNGEDLEFNFWAEYMAFTDPNTKLRSNKSESEKNRLSITAKNPNKEIYTYIRKIDEAKDVFCNYDMSKIIDFPMKSAIPEIYTLTEGKEKDKAVIVNSVKSDNVIIPIGIISTYSGKMSFTLEGMDAYDAKIYFVDVENDEAIETEITGRTSFEYEFDYTPGLNAKGEAVANENRFRIQFSPLSQSGCGELETDLNIIAYAYNSDIVALSSADNLINAIQVFDIQGRLLFGKTDIRSSSYKAENILVTQGAYIVKVDTERGMKKIKIIK
ncbi:T9SS type A sorting domain-containing protein, partial [Bacteroidales bacterium OttesenSCG-928-A17]|nr:T9SS type A sorting domain-containing protein [Bacteroidales bacterium OttesenSCG-928-A17]